MTLYKKHRPQSWEEVVGNSQITQSLQYFLENTAKMPSCFLFSGDVGCGKTTFARLLKKYLKVSDKDFTEINASNNRGIDTTREILQKIKYKPLESPYRIYMLDEVHKMTNDAQNSLLKVLEDTPSHIIFILATSELPKIIKAVQSRSTIYNVSLLQDKEMALLIKNILRKERKRLDDSVIKIIVQSAQGSPRNGLQILDNVLSVPADLQIETAKKIETETIQAIELARNLLKKANWKIISGILNGLNGQDAETIRRIVIGYMQSVLLSNDNTHAGYILEQFIEPNFTNGFPQLVLSCYIVTKN